MTQKRTLRNEEDGAAAIELAFALPILIAMMWMVVQLGFVYQALAGMQQALGQGARYATLCINPSSTGCSAPSADQIRTKINDSVFGTAAGQFDVPVPTSGTSGTSKFYDLTVNYTQPTTLLVFPGPTINITRKKRVWTAG